MKKPIPLNSFRFIFLYCLVNQFYWYFVGRRLKYEFKNTNFPSTKGSVYFGPIWNVGYAGRPEIGQSPPKPHLTTTSSNVIVFFRSNVSVDKKKFCVVFEITGRMKNYFLLQFLFYYSFRFFENKWKELMAVHNITFCWRMRIFNGKKWMTIVEKKKVETFQKRVLKLKTL